MRREEISTVPVGISLIPLGPTDLLRRARKCMEDDGVLYDMIVHGRFVVMNDSCLQFVVPDV